MVMKAENIDINSKKKRIVNKKNRKLEKEYRDSLYKKEVETKLGHNETL